MIKQDKETHQSQASDAGSLPPMSLQLSGLWINQTPETDKEPAGSLNIKTIGI
jgi:hypothetical protein